MTATFVSLFSGVGGFDMGLEAAGWRCVAQVEWDKHCQGVLAHHWPDVPRWSDVSESYTCRCGSVQLRDDGRPALPASDGAGPRGTGCPCGGIPHADVVAFGSPCQDLSVAGKRAGFDGKRSVLFYEATRIIREMREASNGRYPTWVVWENVGGALSSSGGRDFAAVLDELADLGAVDIAWRVLDARWFGVPQRRRRVFVVADLAGQRAGTIHTEPEGVPWHPRTGRAPGQGAAAGTGGRTFDLSIRGRDGGANVEVTEELAAALRAADGGSSLGRTILHVDAMPSLPASLGSGGMGHNKDGFIVAVTPHTPAPVGYSAIGKDIAASLLVSHGGLRTTDVDGATWVVVPHD